MDIAVQFEKYNLDDNKFVFKPISVMRGMYCEESDTFVSEVGIEYHPLNDANICENNFFGYNTTISKLEKEYGKKDSESELLARYFHNIQNNYYIGYLSESAILTIMKMPCSGLSALVGEDGNLDFEDGEIESFDDDENQISFSLDDVKYLRDLNSIDDVREILDLVISENSDEEVQLETNSSLRKKIDRNASKKFNLAKLRKEVLTKIVAQDDAVKKVTTTLAVNYTSTNPRNKSHILIVGPSGTGKTEMINVVADYLDVPCFKADATAYTEEGYVGKSVYSMLNGLVAAADGDIEKAQNGILIIDEIDKKSENDSSGVSREAVLHSLLKIMDRTVIEVSKEHYGSFNFDTSNLTIICMGAFSQLYRKKSNNNGIGFDNAVKGDDANISISRDDIIKYGMPEEFMGRINKIIYTKNFVLEDIVEILYKSKLSPIKVEREWFKDQGVVTVFKKSFYDEVAKRCISSTTGARNIKSLVNDSLEEAHEEVLMNPGKIKKLVFTNDTVKNPKNFSVK